MHITRRKLIGAAAVLAGSTALPAIASPRPNILIVMLDDIGVQGLDFYPDASTPEFSAGELDTPAMTAFANDSARVFETCMSTPICWSTRTEAMTGYKTHELNAIQTIGANSTIAFPRCDSETSKFIFQKLREQGYKVGHFGKWHLTIDFQSCVGTPHGLGIQEYWVSFMKDRNKKYRYYNTRYTSSESIAETQQVLDERFTDDIATDKCRDFISRQAATGQPWFCNYWPNLAHMPQDKVPGRPLASTPEQRHKDQISYADYLFSRIYEALRETGQIDNTLIILTSDNGGTKAAGGKKGQVMQKGVHVPFVMRWKGHVVPGREPRLMQVADIAPTILAAAGAPIDRKYTRDLRALFSPGAVALHDYVTAQTFDKNWMIRNQQYMLRTPIACRVRTKLCKHVQLFDLKADPNERSQIRIHKIADRKERDSLKELRKKLLQAARKRGLHL